MVPSARVVDPGDAPGVAAQAVHARLGPEIAQGRAPQGPGHRTDELQARRAHKNHYVDAVQAAEDAEPRGDEVRGQGAVTEGAGEVDQGIFTPAALGGVQEVAQERRRQEIAAGLPQGRHAELGQGRGLGVDDAQERPLGVFSEHVLHTGELQDRRGELGLAPGGAAQDLIVGLGAEHTDGPAEGVGGAAPDFSHGEEAVEEQDLDKIRGPQRARQGALGLQEAGEPLLAPRQIVQDPAIARDDGAKLSDGGEEHGGFGRCASGERDGGAGRAQGEALYAEEGAVLHLRCADPRRPAPSHGNDTHEDQRPRRRGAAQSPR